MIENIPDSNAIVQTPNGIVFFTGNNIGDGALEVCGIILLKIGSSHLCLHSHYGLKLIL